MVEHREGEGGDRLRWRLAVRFDRRAAHPGRVGGTMAETRLRRTRADRDDRAGATRRPGLPKGPVLRKRSVS